LHVISALAFRRGVCRRSAAPSAFKPSAVQVAGWVRLRMGRKYIKWDGHDEEDGRQGEAVPRQGLRREDGLCRRGWGGLVVTQDRDLAERARALGVKALLEVYYRLLDLVGEPVAEDIERAVEETVWRDVSSTPRS
jgi:hypothetical protein